MKVPFARSEKPTIEADTSPPPMEDIRRSRPIVAQEKSGSHEHDRDRLVQEMMSARRMVRDAEGVRVATAQARKRVDLAKVTLGERSPVWWDDGQPDYNRHMARNTPYADWFAALEIPAKPR